MTSHGMQWRGRTYTAAWMTGQAGRQVRVRCMPHHDHEIEVCDGRGRHLGPAHLADAATPEQLQALREARAERRLAPACQRQGRRTASQHPLDHSTTAATHPALHPSAGRPHAVLNVR
ncbi:Mu transposase C-terminal domain-containing protein [Streptomyces sp. NPDC057496]|uniref:Mu transposase C-terminal domain-containing protein n=1 Tax=Streptomyces sp. NPDC057496 TaxID=3346149 RepID=UPI0036B5FA07